MLPRITLARLAQAFSLGVPQQQALQQAWLRLQEVSA